MNSSIKPARISNAKSAKDQNKWLEDTLRHYKYKKLPRSQKGLLREYLLKMTGISSSQLTKLIKRHQTEATLDPKEYKRNKFASFYTKKDIEFYQKYLNPYLNYHRPCAFSKTITDKRGKEKKFIPKTNT